MKFGGAELTAEYAKARYWAARRRARYWACLPFTLRCSTETRSSKLWEKYELAMCDCRSWEGIIEELTGKRPKRYDPKGAFQSKAGKLFASINSTNRAREVKQDRE